MASLNKVMLIGRLGQTPELKHTKTQLAVTNFSVATSEMSKDKQEKTEWHKVVCFGKSAENVCKYLTKGSMVYVEGRIATRKYEKDGVTHYSTEIMADSVNFLYSNSSSISDANSASTANGNFIDVTSNASWSGSKDPFGMLSDLPF